MNPKISAARGPSTFATKGRLILDLQAKQFSRPLALHTLSFNKVRSRIRKDTFKILGLSQGGALIKHGMED